MLRLIPVWCDPSSLSLLALGVWMPMVGMRPRLSAGTAWFQPLTSSSLPNLMQGRLSARSSAIGGAPLPLSPRAFSARKAGRVPLLSSPCTRRSGAIRGVAPTYRAWPGHGLPAISWKWIHQHFAVLRAGELRKPATVPAIAVRAPCRVTV